MPVYPLPAQFTAQVAAKASVVARRRAPVAKFNSKGGAKSLYPISTTGVVGIGVPQSHHYMMYQEKGTRPHVMWELAGKTIPIRGPSGVISFRYANPSKIGNLVPIRDNTGAVVGSKIAWYNPGIKAKGFMISSLEEEIQKFWMSLTPEIKVQIVKNIPELEPLLKRARV